MGKSALDSLGYSGSFRHCIVGEIRPECLEREVPDAVLGFFWLPLGVSLESSVTVRDELTGFVTLERSASAAGVSGANVDLECP